jgi:hypothetical protein
MRLGNWLTVDEARSLWQLPNMQTVKEEGIELSLRYSLGAVSVEKNSLI